MFLFLVELKFLHNSSTCKMRSDVIMIDGYNLRKHSQYYLRLKQSSSWYPERDDRVKSYLVSNTRF